MKLAKPLKYLKHHYNNKIFTEAIIGKNGMSIIFPTKYVSVKKMSYLNTLWDDSAFDEINLPMQVGSLCDKEKLYFSYPEDIRILDMPIKFPGSNQYKIPDELIQFFSTISKVAQYEHAMNENIEDYFCYITIDQKLVPKDVDTRKGGIHVDGFQGARIEKPLPVDHSYIIYDKFPTLFYNQRFKVERHWDKNCHNYFEGFQKQAILNNQVSYPPYEILLINAYCLHEAPKAPQEEYRTFFRMSYTVREFDRLGNAHNPMFEYNWEMLPRNIQDTLVCPMKEENEKN